MFQVSTAFAVPFANVRLPDAAALNAELRLLLLSREGEGERYRNRQPSMQPRPNLFESEFRLFQWPDACVQQLRERCYQALFGLVGELNGHPPEYLSRLTVTASSWFHITRSGGYFGLHNHPMASWSGVYCVDPGVDSSGHPDSGLLSFPHPNSGALMFTDLANTRLKAPFSHGARVFRLEAGQLLLFPSWLMHQVLPFQGEGERITVAFNAWFKLQDRAQDRAEPPNPEPAPGSS